MAGKMSKTNVAARRQAREGAKKTCPECHNELEVAMVVEGRGKTTMVRLCCERAASADASSATA